MWYKLLRSYPKNMNANNLRYDDIIGKGFISSHAPTLDIPSRIQTIIVIWVTDTTAEHAYLVLGLPLLLLPPLESAETANVAPRARALRVHLL